MALTITSRIVSDVVILDVTGRFNVSETELRQLVTTFLEQGRRHFLLNLAGVPYVGTWAISQMISVWTSIIKNEGTMGLVAPPKPVLDVLRITRLDRVFTIYGTEADALKRISK